MKRAKRIDRNHVIYRITCTVTGETYIGLTASKGRAYLGSAKRRLSRHISQARTENRSMTLHDRIRLHGADQFIIEVLDVVRGKPQAHEAEIALIRLHNPPLNILGATQVVGA